MDFIWLNCLCTLGCPLNCVNKYICDIISVLCTVHWKMCQFIEVRIWWCSSYYQCSIDDRNDILRPICYNQARPVDFAKQSELYHNCFPNSSTFLIPSLLNPSCTSNPLQIHPTIIPSEMELSRFFHQSFKPVPIPKYILTPSKMLLSYIPCL